MAQFRNFLVHRYEHIDVRILVTMLENHLEDFEQFRKEILTFMRDTDDTQKPES